MTSKSIEFISIRDGVAYLTTYKRVTDFVSKGKNDFPDIRSKARRMLIQLSRWKQNDENGITVLSVIGLRSEAGNNEEADGKIVSKSGTLYDFRGRQNHPSSFEGLRMSISQMFKRNYEERLK